MSRNVVFAMVAAWAIGSVSGAVLSRLARWPSPNPDARIAALERRIAELEARGAVGSAPLRRAHPHYLADEFNERRLWSERRRTHRIPGRDDCKLINGHVTCMMWTADDVRR